MSATSGPRAGAGIYAGLFLVTLSTLMYEVALTRIFSATMWYHFAFVAISVALFGLTAGALLVHLLPRRFGDAALGANLWRFSLAFALALALCFVTQLSIPFNPHLHLAGAWSVLLTCVVISVPFVLSGVVVCLALTRFPRQVNRLYATDLIGAALGCVLLVALFVLLDGPSLVVAIGGLAAVGAFCFAAGARSRRGMGWTAVAALALGGFAAANGYLHAQGDPLLRITWAKGESDPRHSYEKWNAFSRITVDGDVDALQRPSGVGLSRRLPAAEQVRELQLVIDSTASTVLTRYSGSGRETNFLRYDISNLAHHVRSGADVLVVGVGGGRDILSALEFGQKSVTGVEINSNVLRVTNDEYGDFTGHLDRDPRVTFVVDEARSYLARTAKRYDLIQISLIDTWAASAAGAYALTENSLYTAEAWGIFFDRLAPGGILSVSRWWQVPGTDKPLEAYRTVALAAQALKNRGVARPRGHVLVYNAPEAGEGASAVTTLVSPEPFSARDVATLDRVAERLGFAPVLTPQRALDRLFAGLVAPEGPAAAVAAFTEDVSPPTDDRPFFFQMADLETLLSGGAFGSADSLRPVFVLGLLLLTVLTLTVCCIVVPLLVTTERTAHAGMLPFYGYFAAIGLGFLLLEIAMLQRLTVFLGHPTYALTVVLFSLLVFSGIGSMVSGRLATAERAAARLAPLVGVVVVAAAIGVATPQVIDAMDDAATPARIATAVGLLVPLGLLLGMPFAIGMRAAAERPGTPTAFLWGINGASSVLASVLGVVISLFFGISTTYWAGLVAYCVAAVSLLLILRPGESLETARARSRAEARI